MTDLLRRIYIRVIPLVIRKRIGQLRKIIRNVLRKIYYQLYKAKNMLFNKVFKQRKVNNGRSTNRYGYAAEIDKKDAKIRLLITKLAKKEARIETLLARASSADKKMTNALFAEFRKVPMHRYGSLTAGKKEWEEKWDRSKGKRVLMYAYRDHASSLYKWADAVNMYSDFAVRLVAFKAHQYEYDYDLLLPFPHVLERSDMPQIIHEADIIHIKDETGFYLSSNKLPKDIFGKFNGPVVYTAYGGYFRHYASDKAFQKYVLSYDARLAMTPDLIFPWFEGEYMPQAIDITKFPYCWKDGRILAHSPSTPSRKGTDDLIESIKGLDIQFDLIQGLTNKECVLRKQKATLFFDQAGVDGALGTSRVVGYYGISALEAAVCGIPTIAHISNRAFEGARLGGRDIVKTCAILNTQRGSSEIRKTIDSFFALTHEERKDISIRTRRWIEDFHSYQACARELSKIYSRLLGFS